MVEKRLINFSSFILFLIFNSCISKSDYFYLHDMATEVENRNYTSNYVFADFYVTCNQSETIHKIHYQDIYNLYYSKYYDKISSIEYLRKLFNNDINFKDTDCVNLNKELVEDFSFNKKMIINKTSKKISDTIRILNIDLEYNYEEMETLLYLYFKEGYLINENDYSGETILYKSYSIL